jgi:hypothetical protein
LDDFVALPSPRGFPSRRCNKFLSQDAQSNRNSRDSLFYIADGHHRSAPPAGISATAPVKVGSSGHLSDNQMQILPTTEC